MWFRADAWLRPLDKSVFMRISEGSVNVSQVQYYLFFGFIYLYTSVPSSVVAMILKRDQTQVPTPRSCYSQTLHIKQHLVVFSYVKEPFGMWKWLLKYTVESSSSIFYLFQRADNILYA